MTQRLVLASNNAGKLKEFAQLLAPIGFELHPQGEFNVPEAEEPHATFVENALAKARHAARLTGLPSLADDSGVCVNALGGAPGVYSARYAGEPSDDARNNQRLLEALRVVPTDQRGARFRCVAAYVDPARGVEILRSGVCDGEILRAPRGVLGFGYDPLFLLPRLGKTMAELPVDEKNQLSHRAAAFRALAAVLPDDLR
jgi:XTP/dITP diphosphohydrolase